MYPMLVSIIIPTYNGTNTIVRLLDGLKDQSMSPQSFEVIVVDDGSAYDEKLITSLDYPYHLIFIRQSNQGATIARNNGALQSRGEVLVFIDDDVTISCNTLETLYKTCTTNKKILATGSLIQRGRSDNSLYARLVGGWSIGCGQQEELLPFFHCNTQLLAIRREDFIDLGMMQDPNHWHYWDDVEFGYRAFLAGFQLLKCSNIQGTHWDHNMDTLDLNSRRWYRASKAAVDLFQRYPEMQAYLPIFYDKTPIDWRRDPLYLIARKWSRQVVSYQISISLMEQIVSVMERYCPSPKFLRCFYRWIQGGYMVRGYFEGLNEVRKS
jgi:glycosyltransferase involved in cell wall biosynthesis